jgi:hypothetical protein
MSVRVQTFMFGTSRMALGVDSSVGVDHSTDPSGESSLELIGDTVRRGPVNTPAQYRDRREVKFVCGPAPKYPCPLSIPMGRLGRNGG